MKKQLLFMLLLVCLLLASHYGRAQNVGIGTTTPSERLEVNGSIKITDGTQANGKVLTSDANGKAEWKRVVRKDTLSISSISFVSISGTHHTTPFKTYFQSAIYNDALVAPVNLPSGAVVSQIMVKFFDNDYVNDYTIGFWSIPQGLPLPASLATAATANAMSTAVYSVLMSIPTPITIDNTYNFYYLAMTGNFLNAYDGICGVRIAYTYPVNN